MAFGTAHLVTDAAEKRRAMDGFVDRFFPGRSQTLRPPNAQEIKATSFVVMEMEQASGKIRDTHVSDDEEDYALPIWAAWIPVRQALGEPGMPATTSRPGRPPGAEILRWRPHLDEALMEAYRKAASG